jgi:hypothetical protein
LCSSLHLETTVGHELFKECLKLSIGLGGKFLVSANGVEDVSVLGAERLEVKFFEAMDLGGEELVEETTDTGVQDADLFFGGDGDVLLLLEEFSELLSTVELLLGSGVEVGTELGKGGDFTVLSELELHGTSDLLHGLDLGSRADTGDGETDVNGGADTLVEEFSLQEDLTISDGNNVGGDVSGHITSLSLNDGKGGEGTGTVVIVHLGGALEETGMEVEDITGVSLTTWGATEEERHLTVSNGLLGEIVVDNEAVHAVVTEVFSDSASRVGGKELEGSGIGGSGGNDDSVLEGVTVTEETHNVGDGGTLLTNGDVDAVEGLGLVSEFVVGLLVEDGVNGDGSFSSLSVTNDKFTLSTANGNLNIIISIQL